MHPTHRCPFYSKRILIFDLWAILLSPRLSCGRQRTHVLFSSPISLLQFRQAAFYGLREPEAYSMFPRYHTDPFVFVLEGQPLKTECPKVHSLFHFFTGSSFFSSNKHWLSYLLFRYRERNTGHKDVWGPEKQAR